LCWQYAVVILGTLDTANERGMALFTEILGALYFDHRRSERRRTAAILMPRAAGAVYDVAWRK
jgi:hypothetical protein